jgi:hypothetical protein
MTISVADLQAHVGKPIGDVCSNDFSSASHNHCAHFVSHALSIKLGMLCGDMKFKTRKTGASIRCDELYNALSSRGAWSDRPKQDDGILIFVLSARHVSGNVMSNHPQKHVGIHHSGEVFNFSNSQGKVVVDATVNGFLAKFKTIYAGGDISLFYGVPP